jgi:putative membrane protein insertion efficiency factor
MRQLLMGMIRAYQLVLGPMLGPRCRFYPSCSCYAHTAIERHGVVRGMWLGARRLLRCHPFCAGGFDPVPDQRSTNA